MNSTEICAIAFYLANDLVLRGILYFRAIVFVAGLILFATFFKVQGSYLAFHKNARLLLTSSYIWTILQTVTGLIISIFDIIRYSDDHTDPCEYTLSAVVATLVRGPPLWAMSGSVWALLSMAFERCIASLSYRTYEKKGNAIGIATIAIQVRQFRSCLDLGRNTLISSPITENRVRLLAYHST